MVYLVTVPSGKLYYFESSQDLEISDFVLVEYPTLHNRNKQTVFKVIGKYTENINQITIAHATIISNALIVNVFRCSTLSNEFLKECFSPQIYAVSIGFDRSNKTYDFIGYGRYNKNDLVVVETEYQYLIAKIEGLKDETSYDGELKEIMCIAK